jgi:steroid delta-isomerase-like uncharacterized protein
MTNAENAPAETTAERARRLIESVSRRDIETLREYWDDDTVDDFIALGQQIRGRDALTAFFKELFAAVPDMRMDIEDLIADGDKAVVRWRLSGAFTGAPFQGIRPTGRAIDLRGVDVMHFAGDKLRLNTVYYDGATFARQVGMLPAQGSAGERAMTSAFNAITAAKDRLKRR